MKSEGVIVLGTRWRVTRLPLVPRLATHPGLAPPAAATNFPESLDAALTRPGRFDVSVMVPIPDVKGRKEILELYLSKVQADECASRARHG